MHKNTPNIKEQINSQYDDSYDRVKYLKDQYKGETAYILASGPSFTDIGTINSTKSIYEWLQSKEIELEIIDPYGDNPAYEKIKRIKTL
jgi:uncharacterized protein YciI